MLSLRLRKGCKHRGLCFSWRQQFEFSVADDFMSTPRKE
jgi:hypothetical protein